MKCLDGPHSMVGIAHGLDMLAESDWIIDRDPEGGTSGRPIVAVGTPEVLVAQGTHTGRAVARGMGPA